MIVAAHLDMTVNGHIDSPRILHILDHDLAPLQTRIAKSPPEDLYRNNLHVRPRSVTMVRDSSRKGPKKKSNLGIQNVICNCQELLRNPHL